MLAEAMAEAGVAPEQWFEPLTGPIWHYRRKARLSARYVFKKERLLLGFRERKGRYVADMTECHVLDERVASRLEELAALIHSLQSFKRIPQIEVACGDDSVALVFRHLDPLPEADIEALRNYARESGIAVYLQPKGPATIHLLEPEGAQLRYAIPAFDVDYHFEPADFIQVNAEMNQTIVSRALELLQPGPDDRVLDLFCGLGNFTLPLARHAGEVVGVEGSEDLVQRGQHNAARNGIENVRFHCADLTLEPDQADWLRDPYDKVLVDPPRSGALEMLPHIAASGAQRLVYVSCNPDTLARDAAVLTRDHGFALRGAGVADMFPHTGHVESIALFERQA